MVFFKKDRNTPENRKDFTEGELNEIITDISSSVARTPNPENFNLNDLKHVSSIGITASASAPDLLVNNFIQLISNKFQINIHEENSIKENVFFKIPQQLIKEN